RRSSDLYFKARIIRQRQMQHRQPVLYRGLGFVTLVRWIGSRHVQQPAQAERVRCILAEYQMSDMRRVECPAQYADTHAYSAHSSSKSPMNTVSPTCTPASSSARVIPSVSSTL